MCKIKLPIEDMFIQGCVCLFISFIKQDLLEQNKTNIYDHLHRDKDINRLVMKAGHFIQLYRS